MTGQPSCCAYGIVRPDLLALTVVLALTAEVDDVVLHGAFGGLGSLSGSGLSSSLLGGLLGVQLGQLAAQLLAAGGVQALQTVSYTHLTLPTILRV